MVSGAMLTTTSKVGQPQPSYSLSLPDTPSEQMQTLKKGVSPHCPS